MNFRLVYFKKTMIKIKPIDWAVVHEYHGVTYQAELYRPYMSVMPMNPYYLSVKNPIEYDQKKDKSCVVFSAMAMISYNCNLEFEDTEWREIWQEIQWNRWGDIFLTSREMGQRFILNSFPIFINTHEGNIFLEKNWWLQIEVWCDPKWIEEGVLTGKITKILPMGKTRFIHAMLLYKREWRYYLQNSWRETKDLWGYNIFDITDIYHDSIKAGIIRPYGMAIVPYFNNIGKTTTTKDHARALMRVWINAITDTWKSFKNKVAKVDWIIN